ncbi:hypothetical protein SAMN04487785_106116 [Dyella jiangningensis]|nr:hypothetical protein BDW41_104241 [Dyella sp. AtDHG13]SDK25550.1 hypothetical protein SAMN04487785_106116 [Dyella jiangningensis]
MCRAAARAVGFGLWALDLPGPRMRRRAGGDQAPQGCLAGARHFSSGRDAPSKSPEPVREPIGLQPDRRLIRGALLFGYFLLGKQEKVTRPPARGRNARRAGGRIAKALVKSRLALRDNRPLPKLDPGLRRDDGSFEVMRQEWPLTPTLSPEGRGRHTTYLQPLRHDKQIHFSAPRAPRPPPHHTSSPPAAPHTSAPAPHTSSTGSGGTA